MTVAVAAFERSVAGSDDRFRPIWPCSQILGTVRNGCLTVAHQDDMDLNSPS